MKCLKITVKNSKIHLTGGDICVKVKSHKNSLTGWRIL